MDGEKHTFCLKWKVLSGISNGAARLFDPQASFVGVNLSDCWVAPASQGSPCRKMLLSGATDLYWEYFSDLKLNGSSTPVLA